MSFLNLALLGGIAAFMVPLLIHLLNRTKLQSIDWGAMHLLEAAMQVNSRRFQWESYLLLLLRCLIPALFAIGLARPVLTSLRSGAAQGESAVLVVVDNSLSMLAPTREGSVSRYTKATELAKGAMRDQGKAQLSVWTAGSGYVNLVDGDTFDSALAIRALDEQTAGAGQFDVAQLIGEATSQLSAMQNPNRQLVIISDFQKSQWGQLSSQQFSEIKQQLDNTIGKGQLTLLAVSDDSSVVENISVRLSDFVADAGSGAQANLSAPQLEPLFEGSPFRVQAIVHNWNALPAGDVRVDFAVDGQILSSERITLSPESEQQVEFACSFDAPGSHFFSVRVGIC